MTNNLTIETAKVYASNLFSSYEGARSVIIVDASEQVEARAAEFGGDFHFVRMNVVVAYEGEDDAFTFDVWAEDDGKGGTFLYGER